MTYCEAEGRHADRLAEVGEAATQLAVHVPLGPLVVVMVLQSCH